MNKIITALLLPAAIMVISIFIEAHFNYGGWIPANLSLQTNPIVKEGIAKALEKLQEEDGKKYRIDYINSIHTQVVTGINYKVSVTFVEEECESACAKKCDVIVKMVNWVDPVKEVETHC